MRMRLRADEIHEIAGSILIAAAIALMLFGPRAHAAPGLVAAVPLATTAPAATAPWPTLEVGPVLPVYPDRSLSIGGALSARVTVLRGHLVFGDAMLANGYSALGFSVSSRTVDDDNGLRYGALFWQEQRNTRWAIVFRQAIAGWTW